MGNILRDWNLEVCMMLDFKYFVDNVCSYEQFKNYITKLGRNPLSSCTSSLKMYKGVIHTLRFAVVSIRDRFSHYILTDRFKHVLKHIYIFIIEKFICARPAFEPTSTRHILVIPI